MKEACSYSKKLPLYYDLIGGIRVLVEGLEGRPGLCPATDVDFPNDTSFCNVVHDRQFENQESRFGTPATRRSLPLLIYDHHADMDQSQRIEVTTATTSMRSLVVFSRPCIGR